MIKNFTVSNDKITKKVVINKKTGVLTPVGRADKSTIGSKNVGTYQEVSVGDYVLMSELVDGEPSITLHIVVDIPTGKTVPAPAGTSIALVLGAVSQSLLDWLLDYTPTPFLPKGCGWDGVYSKSDLIKQQKVVSVLPPDLDSAFISRLLNATYFTSDKIISASPIRHYRNISPVLNINADVYDYCILKYDNHSTLKRVFNGAVIELVDELKEVILIQFIALKVKDNEQFIWKRIKFDLEV